MPKAKKAAPETVEESAQERAIRLAKEADVKREAALEEARSKAAKNKRDKDGIPHVGKPVAGEDEEAPAVKYKGSFINLADREEYALAIVEGDPHGKTHHLKNSKHSWHGTKAEFQEAFEKN